MEAPLLSDKNQYPSEDVIFFHIGKTKTLWLSFFKWIHSQYPDISEEWRYYLDGKSWLLKATQKKKTIFWLSIVKDSFRTTFYFGDKAEETIKNSALSEACKTEFLNGKRYGKIRGITIRHTNKMDTEEAKILVEIKSKLK
jgi:hypothetical protein